MRIVVLGCNGMLGSALCTTLSASYQTIGIARRPSPQTDYVCDLLSPALWPLLDQIQADAIINTAAITNLTTCQQHIDQAYKLHVDLSQRLSTRHEKSIYISTDSVFDGAFPPPLGYSESSIPAPLNVYALTKLLGEAPVLQAGGLAIRTNIYGFNAHAPGGSIFEWIMSSLRQNRPMTGYKDIVFNPVSVWQLSRSLEFCLGKDIYGLVNVAGDTSISKADFLATIIRLNQPNFTMLETQDAPITQIVRPKQTTLDTRFAAQLGLPIQNLEEGISEASRLYDSRYRP